MNMAQNNKKITEKIKQISYLCIYVNINTENPKQNQSTKTAKNLSLVLHHLSYFRQYIFTGNHQCRNSLEFQTSTSCCSTPCHPQYCCC